ncbi:hypothetical protein ACFCYM_35155, partial [Streptomyces sp. NPDC056254]|uniref:hypothetical protein n=1 Tax=Streptomyces sp. NPDC056254 TaxID=3345763 RepID=UPI0035DDB73F
MAEELGAHQGALRNWIWQAEACAGERGDLPTTAEREDWRPLSLIFNLCGVGEESWTSSFWAARCLFCRLCGRR